MKAGDIVRVNDIQSDGFYLDIKGQLGVVVDVFFSADMEPLCKVLFISGRKASMFTWCVELVEDKDSDDK